MVELVLVVPLLLTLSLGVFETGRALYSNITVIQAARDGARVAMDPKNTTAAVVLSVTTTAAPIRVYNGDVVVCKGKLVGDVCNSNTTGEVGVSVTYWFETPIPWVSNFWGGGPLRLQRNAYSQVDS